MVLFYCIFNPDSRTGSLIFCCHTARPVTNSIGMTEFLKRKPAWIRVTAQLSIALLLTICLSSCSLLFPDSGSDDIGALPGPNQVINHPSYYYRTGGS